MVFGLLLFTAVPRLLYIFIDGRIAVLDEQGNTTRSFQLKPQRVLWREINSLDFGPLGVRMATMRGTVNLPLAFGESSIEQVTEIVTWFRSDLFPSQLGVSRDQGAAEPAPRSYSMLSKAGFSWVQTHSRRPSRWRDRESRKFRSICGFRRGP